MLDFLEFAFLEPFLDVAVGGRGRYAEYLGQTEVFLDGRSLRGLREQLEGLVVLGGVGVFVPVGAGEVIIEPEMDALSNIVKEFNDTYGNIEWKDKDEVQRQIEELPKRLAASEDFVNAVRNGDNQVAQITFNDEITAIVAAMLEEKTEFVQTYFANVNFQNFVNERVFRAAIQRLMLQGN